MKFKVLMQVQLQGERIPGVKEVIGLLKNEMDGIRYTKTLMFI